nr:uncharacterized protein I203_01292 [Kwoniella mangroviensis CBS 8507]OCF69435.1 hypothetical protein I203_01292 [Kwoniella mangroviensis CBS 8507]
MALKLLLVILACPIITSTIAQTTVPTGNGVSFQCSWDPSAIQAFAGGSYCDSYLTSKAGSQWPLANEVVTVSYSKAPTSYYSTAVGDIYLIGKIPVRRAISGCRYNAGAPSGDTFATGIKYNIGGLGFQQSCPVVQANKPRPSPGLYYKKRFGLVTTFACPIIQEGGPYYLTNTQYSLSSTGQNYICTYRTTSPGQFQCRYDANGQLLPNSATVPANVNCPLSQCQAVQPYMGKRGLPQPADKRQTSRERIIARQKEIWGTFAEERL